MWVSGDAIGECIRIKGEKMDSIKIAKTAKKKYYEVFRQSVDPFAPRYINIVVSELVSIERGGSGRVQKGSA